MFAVKILLAAESILFAASYVRNHTYEEQRPVVEIPWEDAEGWGTEQRAGSGVYGIGFEMDSRMFFWFRSRMEISGEE